MSYPQLSHFDDSYLLLQGLLSPMHVEFGDVLVELQARSIGQVAPGGSREVDTIVEHIYVSHAVRAGITEADLGENARGLLAFEDNEVTARNEIIR